MTEDFSNRNKEQIMDIIAIEKKKITYNSQFNSTEIYESTKKKLKNYFATKLEDISEENKALRSEIIDI